jgi:hypothetical protein
MNMSRTLAALVAGASVACSSSEDPSAVGRDASPSMAGGGGAPNIPAASAGGNGGGANIDNSDPSEAVVIVPVDAAADALSDASADAPSPVFGASLTAADVVAASNLVAWYRFADASDPGADSSKSGANDAFFGDGVKVAVDPERGYVGIFDGAANEAFPPSVQVDMTLAMWLQTSTPGTGKEGGPWLDGSALLDGESGGPVNDYGWTLLGSHVAFGVGNPDMTFDASTGVVDGKWHHVAVTRDDATGAVVLYTDGAPDGGGKGATGKRDKVNAHLLCGSAFVGRMSDIRLYDRVLTPTEIVRMTKE